MSTSILKHIFLSLVFLFALETVAGAQDSCEFICGPPSGVPLGVAFAYKCEMDCPSCPEGYPGCNACDRLEMVFGKELRCCSLLVECGEPER